MTDRELDELATSLLAQDAASKRRPRTPPADPKPVDEPAAGDWTGDWTEEQMRRLDDVFRGHA